MVDRGDLGSWLSGEVAAAPEGYVAGERLGRPASGPGSVAGLGRRFASVLIDWVICLLIVRGFAGEGGTAGAGSLWVSVVFALENLLLVATAGGTIGQRLLRLRVETLEGARPGPLAALGRAVLLALAVPALTVLWERDRRGLHEQASGTLVARF